ncbi:hypothetical protein IU501_32640 [Nocardia otitidiscaviarum]|uniref:hypothetical protein n=1 Tax=Nocardia otitidiscaviarum TaxID=1823 RepID=UPI0004A6AC76|nr:hypothetical protein [Nocardia otitidiscaviarum]MBF6137720.1 hypothetical protein [Nocardia otitidiscaviarum]MBF6488628.1 hypothetical protein [Nocardia otitidiscaviarum]
MADKRPVNRVTPKRRTSGTPQDSSSRRALGREGQTGSARRTAADADRARAGDSDRLGGGTTARGETRAKAGTPKGASRAAGVPAAASAKAGSPKVRLGKAGRATSSAAATSPGGETVSRAAAARGGSWRLAIGCGIAAVLLGVFAVVAALRPGVDDDNLAYVDNQATDEVKAAADHALSTLYGYRAAEIDQWKDSVGAVLTERMRADLEQYIDTTVSTIKQAATDTEVTTDPIGVTLLTPERAELLVNLNVSAVRDGAPEPLASGPVVLRMQKVDGRWLAAEIADN